jgi:hypothetical protein
MISINVLQHTAHAIDGFSDWNVDSGVRPLLSVVVRTAEGLAEMAGSQNWQWQVEDVIDAPLERTWAAFPVGWRGWLFNALVIRRTMRKRARDTVRGLKRLLEAQASPEGIAAEPAAAPDPARDIGSGSS